MMNLSALKRVSILLFFFIVGFVIYSNTLEAPFYFDDISAIKDNANIRATRLTEIGNAGFKSSSTRPIAFISFALNYYLHQYNLKGYHLVNIIIHILTGIFLYLFIKETLNLSLLGSKDHFLDSIAFLSAIIWLVHPLHTQSVTYIVQRCSSMAAMFYLLSLLLYVKGRLALENAKRWSWYGGSFLAGLLALGSKESAAVLPFFIFLYEWYFFQNLDRDWLKRHLKYVFGVVLLFGLIALIYLGTNPFEKLNSLKDYSHNEFTLTQRVLTQFRVVIYYLSLLAYPHPSRLNLDYDFPLSHSLIDPVTTLFSLCIIFGLIGLAVYTAKKERLLSFCILWFFGNLVIESSVIPLAIIFEHRTYLPSMLVYLLTVALGYRYIKYKWSGVALVCVVTALFSFWTYQRNSVWQDPVALWRDCVEKSPEKARPHNNLGVVLAKQDRIVEAIKHYSVALQINPNYADAHSNLGILLGKQGKTTEAIQHYSEALRIKSGFAEAHNNLGTLLAEKGKLVEAIQHYAEALRINPDFKQAHNNLGALYAKQGRTAEAVQHYDEALRINPDYAEAHHNLGILLATQGKTTEAIQHYSEALRINPDNAAAHNNLGIALSKQGETTEAIQHYSEALRIDPDYVEAHHNLGNALIAEKGPTDQAIGYFTKALQIKPDYVDAYNSLATALIQMGKIGEALVYLQKALQIEPDSADTHINLGIALMSNAKINAAIDHFRQALQIKPSIPEAHVNLGTALINTGKIDEAIAHYREALRLEPGHAEAQNNLKRAEAILKELNAAITDIKASLKLYPRDSGLHYNLGILYQRKGKLDAAIDEYQQALSIEPEFIEALNNLALTYMVKNENEKALALFTKLTALQPDNAGHYYNLACIYSRNNQVGASIDVLKKAVKKGYHNWELIKSDKDLANIRSSSYYKELVKGH